MKNKFFYFALALLAVMLFTSGAYAKDNAGSNFSKDDLKRMSTFLSNFTEIGFMNFTAEEFLNSSDQANITRFGIWHNYINNFKSRISQCKTANCPHGSLQMDGKYVIESVEKYFGVKLSRLVSVTESDPPYYYDGKNYHFEGADGETPYYARVDKAVADASGRVTMSGVVYNANDASEILGTFIAVAKPHKFAGKNTWAIISLATQYADED